MKSDGSDLHDLTAPLASVGATPLSLVTLPNGTLIGSVSFSQKPASFGRYLSDPTLPIVDFAQSDFDVLENAGSASINLVRTGDTSAPLSSSYATKDRTAKGGVDYTPQSGIVSFASLETETSFSIPILNDVIVNGSRTVLLTLTSAPSAEGSSELARATLTIHDNEIPTLLDPNFDPKIGNLQVCVLAITIDGRLVVGVSELNGAITGRRLNSDGSVDSTFTSPESAGNVVASANCASPIHSIVLSDGGRLTTDGDCIKRLNPDGSENPALQFCTFNFPELSGGFISWLGLRANGQIIAAVEVFPVFGSGRDHGLVIVLNPDGTLANAAVPDIAVKVLLVAPDESIYAATYSDSLTEQATLVRILPPNSVRTVGFSSSNLAVSETVGTASLTVVRTGDTSGTLNVDYTSVKRSAKAFADFDPQSGTLHFPAGEAQQTIEIPIHDNLLVDSNRTFSVLLSNPTDGAFLAHAAASATITIYDDERPGSADFGFVPPPLRPRFNFLGGDISALAVQKDGKFLVAGMFTLTNPVTGLSSSAIRLNPDGLLDTSFQLVAPLHRFDIDLLAPAIAVFAPLQDGRILVGGTQVDGALNLNGELRGGVARILEDGSLDPTFTAELDGGVQAIAIQRDGKAILGGSFSGGIKRLNPNGSIDTTFPVGAGVDTGAVQALALQPDGKIVIAGNFTSVNEAERNGLARLNTDGSLDAEFASHSGNFLATTITSIALQPDGKIVLGGGRQGGLARFSAEGVFDSQFGQNITSADGQRPLVVAAENENILVGGWFLPGITRLKPDGKMDLGFNPGAGLSDSHEDDQSISKILVLPDQTILLGGSFASFDGVSRPGLVRLHGDPAVRFANIHANPTGSAQFGLVTLPDRNYLIESSTDLESWLPFQTNKATGYLLNIQTDTTSIARKFYRARALP